LSTQILILYELYTGHYSKLAPLAQKLNVTQQAISEYITKMKQQGLVQKVERQYKPTVTGVSLLQQEMLTLKEFTDDCVQHLSLITNCISIAATSVKKGQTVSLYMDNGWLYASTNKSCSSTGTALSSAQPGEAVPIGTLKGILDHTLGKISFFSLRDPFLPSQKTFDTKKLENHFKTVSLDTIAVLDAKAKVISKDIGIKPEIQYGGIHAVIDAAQRGLHVGVLGYKQNIQTALAYLEKQNEQTTQPMEYDVFTFY
jgi:predicted transcriptional regulator